MVPSDSRKTSRLTQIVGLAILGLTVVTILFSGSSRIDRVAIEHKLQDFAEYVAHDAASAGKEGKFAYGSIAIEGWGYKKYASVANVTLEFAEKSLLGTNRWSFSTRRMLVVPDAVVPGSLFFIFPEPVNVIENSQLKTTITGAGPFQF